MRIVALFALLTVGSVPAFAQATQASAPPQVVTTGYGEARVVPDRATILVGVQSRAATAAVAGSDNARRQKAILDTLRALGIPERQLSTTNYSVSPEMQYNPNSAPKVTGYVVSNNVRVELTRLDDVGKVIDAALAKGANQISSLQLTSSKADSVRRAAMAIAVRNARADAEALASAAGGSLGPLLELSTNSPPIRMFSQVMETAAPAMARATPIQAGEEAVSATVNARWVFLPRSQ